jgi:hypothetical protein
MEAIKFLTPIARNACEWDELDPQSKGEFLRTLFHSAQLDQDAAQLLLEHIIDTLAESGLLESCEFYEGMILVIPANSTSHRLKRFSIISKDSGTNFRLLSG